MPDEGAGIINTEVCHRRVRDNMTESIHIETLRERASASVEGMRDISYTTGLSGGAALPAP